MVLGELLVPLLTALRDPDGEGLTDERVDDVYDVLARHLAGLEVVGEAVLDGGVAAAKVQDVIQLEVLVEGHGDVPGIFVEDRLKKLK